MIRKLIQKKKSKAAFSAALALLTALSLSSGTLLATDTEAPAAEPQPAAENALAEAAPPASTPAASSSTATAASEPTVTTQQTPPPSAAPTTTSTVELPTTQPKPAAPGATGAPTTVGPQLPLAITAAVGNATQPSSTQATTLLDRVKAGDIVKVQFQVTNPSATALNQVKAEPVRPEQPGQPNPADAVFVPSTLMTSNAVVFAIQPGESVNLQFDLLATKDLTAGIYPVQIRLCAEGYAPSIISSQVVIQPAGASNSLPGGTLPGLPAEPGYDGSGVFDFGSSYSSMGASLGAGAGSDSGQAGNNKPKLIISNYKLNPDMPEAGKDFTLDLTFTNTNRKKAVNNIKITLNGGEGASTAPASAAQAGSGSAGGSVFSPVNSSNTFFIDQIDAEGEAEKTVTMRVVPNATAQNYTMSILFEYEDKDGNEFKATEIIGIPVVQRAKMETGNIDVSAGMVGSPMPIDIDFYNTGKDVLSTFMVSLEGSGFTAENARYYIGNFSPGQSDHFSATVTPEQAGQLKGDVVFTYEDSAGQKHRETVPFNAEITDAAQMMGPDGTPMSGTQGAPATTQPFTASPFFYVVLAIAAAAIAAVVVILTKQKRKSKKDLTLHD